MLRYIIKRLIYMVITLLATVVFLFTLMEFVPGDPALVVLGEGATEENIVAIHKELKLDDPYIVRLTRYIGNLIQGDMGNSYKTRQPIAPALFARLPLTMTIAVWGIIVGTIIGLIAGVVSAVKQYSLFDRILTFISLFGASAPSFWLAMLFVLIFTLKLGWLPATGSYTLKHWILPVATIGLQASATITRMTRSSMLEVIRQDYVRTARAKGQTQFKVVISHGLRNAFIPILTVICTRINGYLGGTVLVESVFAIPGLGNYVLDGVKTMDTPVVLSGVVFICFMCTIVTFLTDMAYAFIDPRIKSTYGFGVKRARKRAGLVAKATEGGNV
ncbi:MAG: ABC transporter permease [Clostridiales bacterium]